MPATITVREAVLDDQPVVWREAPGADVLYLHGAPTSSRDWTPFLERLGGVAPDLAGFGRSGKRADRDYTMHGLAAFVERFADMVELERVTLVVHDWGAAGLLWAMRDPDRIERLVIVNAVPLFADYRWHRIARLWRTPVLGELAMGATTRRVLRRGLRGADGSPPPPELVDAIMADFDLGTQRALLRLYRSASPQALGRAGVGLSDLTCPALVVWGDGDPYIPSHFAEHYAQSLGGETEIAHFADAGHWPWLDASQVIDRVVAFVR
jgi:pimeloyl-ACP methyl ester carboxylesterase